MTNTENPIQLSLFSDLVPASEIETQVAPVKLAKLVKPEKAPKISQGDCVELPNSDRAIVMLVNPMGDCYVEVRGEPFVYVASEMNYPRTTHTLRPGFLTLHRRKLAKASALLWGFS